MVISVNNDPNKNEFQLLLDSSMNTLKKEATRNPSKYLALLGNKLENQVYEIFKDNAKGTVFDGSIELISGQRFPDIIAKKYYGIEVKTTIKGNSWKSTGSSILESTRVEGIERIFMLFGKMCTPIEFKCRPYEECLSEVVVTHSPRYLIDMDLAAGETIFDKIEVPYDSLRRQTNPIKTVLSYYKKHLKPGDNLWYLDQESNIGTNLIIKMWNNLAPNERNEYIILGFCLFPELLSNRTDKFNRFALWLATRKAVICPNVRDNFTAGGQGEIIFNGKKYTNIPQIIMRLYSNIKAIKEKMATLSHEELVEFWEIEFDDKDRYSVWVQQIVDNAVVTIKNKFPLNYIIR